MESDGKQPAALPAACTAPGAVKLPGTSSIAGRARSMMAPDRLPRFSQRNVLAAISRPVIAPNRMWGMGRLVLMAVIMV